MIEMDLMVFRTEQLAVDSNVLECQGDVLFAPFLILVARQYQDAALVCNNPLCKGDNKPSGLSTKDRRKTHERHARM